ncbi:hypothetical protein CK203_081370 [Vitis vinifera]|uniref:Retrotransposon gag domain-containing protein n=1 Tax=Vitis vinifera TaxID=29760 RepID=A0A438DGB0_VITVI|nr:hypothetical protein CK203_081370 [Vitis vinifera]
MTMRSLQPQFSRHLIGFSHVDFGSLVQTLYGIEEGISRRLWLDSSPSSLKGKKPSIGQRSRDVNTISATRPRPPRYYQTVGQTFDVYYLPSPQVQYRPPVPFRPMSPTYLHSTLQPIYATQATHRMDLHCAYHQGLGHDTNRCSALRHAIQDLIDQGLVNLGQPSVTMNPLPTHTTHSVPPPTGDDGYEIVGATHKDTFAQFILWPEDVDVQIMTHSGRIAQATPPVTRPFGEGLIHMMTTDRATCIVFYADDLPSEGFDHTHPLYITIVCSGHKVPSILLDNGSTLNVCPLATIVALGFTPSDFGSSTQTMRAYDSTQREVMGTLTIDLLIGSTTFSILFQVLRIPASFNLFLGRPWIHQAGAIPSSLP